MPEEPVRPVNGPANGLILPFQPTRGRVCRLRLASLLVCHSGMQVNGIVKASEWRLMVNLLRPHGKLCWFPLIKILKIDQGKPTGGHKKTRRP
jgi:hypothetical protein